jgi:ligand-binding sensor domain-containing protein
MRFDGKNWTYIPHRERLVSSDVENMIEDSRGRMWFATRCGLSCFDGSTWRTWTEGDGLYQNSIIGVAAAADGAIWCSSGGVLTRFDGEQFTPYPPPEGEDTPENRFYVTNISIDTEGTVWTGVRKTIRTSDGGSRVVGIWRFRNGAWELFPIDSGSAGYFSRGVVPDDRGLIWLTSSEGMASWDGTRIREYRVNSIGHVLPVEIVPEGDTIWITGRDSPAVTYVSQFRDGVWNIFDPGNGQRTGAYFLETDGMGRKWFSTSSVTVWEADSLRVVIPFGEMPYNSSPAFAVDRNGLVWMGTGQKDKGIFSWDGSSWRNYTVADGLVSNRIHRLEFDAAGVLWVAAEGGISRFDGRTWRSWPLGEAIYRIAFGQNGVTWFSSYQSAYRLENEEIEKFSNPAGLSNPSFQSLAVDANGIVWAGTWAVGVLRFDGREWTQYATANGLLSDRAGAIGIDKYNRKWIATSAGLCVLDDDGPVAVTNGPPAPFMLHGNYPNPFNPSTAIEFSLPAASRVKLTVYDTTGQIVRELASGMLPAGKHSLAWEGRDDAGRPVSSGLYFARLAVGDRVLVHKMLLLK